MIRIGRLESFQFFQFYFYYGLLFYSHSNLPEDLEALIKSRDILNYPIELSHMIYCKKPDKKNIFKIGKSNLITHTFDQHPYHTVLVLYIERAGTIDG